MAGRRRGLEDRRGTGPGSSAAGRGLDSYCGGDVGLDVWMGPRLGWERGFGNRKGASRGVGRGMEGVVERSSGVCSPRCLPWRRGRGS